VEEVAPQAELTYEDSQGNFPTMRRVQRRKEEDIEFPPVDDMAEWARDVGLTVIDHFSEEQPISGGRAEECLVKERSMWGGLA